MPGRHGSPECAGVLTAGLRARPPAGLREGLRARPPAGLREGACPACPAPLPARWTAPPPPNPPPPTHPVPHAEGRVGPCAHLYHSSGGLGAGREGERGFHLTPRAGVVGGED